MDMKLRLGWKVGTDSIRQKNCSYTRPMPKRLDLIP